MPDIKSMTLKELEQYMEEIGEKKFRAKQLYEWMHKKLVRDLDEMSNLPKALKQKIREDAGMLSVREVKRFTSKIDGTAKFLFELYDGSIIETVLMKYKHGNSVCISSQAGCRMGCRFCASTIGGLTRSLEPSEMLDQIYHIQHATGERVSNVVVMGTGEPFDNFEHLLRFLELLTNEQGLNISQRNVTVSTCGIVPKIYELADKKLQITLAISLHSPNDEMRRELMPIANKYSIQEIIDACDAYVAATNRRITFEYSLVRGVNDRPEHAKMLIHLLKGRLCHVNLIPVNPIDERDYEQSTKESIYEFQHLLEKNHIRATVRREMGRDINAACGQLRKSYVENREG
ncbi:MAG: 23S rRNA (adenine(2503)-C(2))-methyltransferase RlmN [Lachnospiraceae bacterium]|nr:23S rRNA (adenine(2503)-C(2))-methyltransferase RlmN [Lachnospiraceae bacterium]